MSPIGKIRISVFLLGILICLLVASVNGQQAGGDSGEDDGSNSEEEQQERGRGKGGPGGRGLGKRGPGKRGHGGPGNHNRKFKKSRKFSDLFEESTDVPNFCQQKACPKFTVESQTEDYELRNYNETNWLTVNRTGRFFWGFRILLNYLNGSNAEKRKIKIGVPMLKEYIGNNSWPERLLFYTSEMNLPTPDDDAVTIVNIPKGLRYVKVFGDYPRPRVTAEKKKQLIGKIGEVYEKGLYYVGIFNPPFQRIDRHNELWLLAKN